MNKEIEKQVLKGLQYVRIGVVLGLLAGLLQVAPGVPGAAAGLLGLLGSLLLLGGLGLCSARDESESKKWAILALVALLVCWLGPLIMVVSSLTFLRFAFYMFALMALCSVLFPTFLLLYCAGTADRWGQPEVGRRFLRLIAIFWLAPILFLLTGQFLPLELQLLGVLSCLVVYLAGILSFSGAIGVLKVE